jgi:hypothetical protein
VSNPTADIVKLFGAELAGQVFPLSVIAAAMKAYEVHSIKLEEQGLSPDSEQNALKRRADRLLSGSLKKLWD